MPRLAPLPREAVTDLGEILSASESRMGFVPNSQLIMARRREILRAFCPARRGDQRAELND